MRTTVRDITVTEETTHIATWLRDDEGQMNIHQVVSQFPLKRLSGLKMTPVTHESVLGFN